MRWTIRTALLIPAFSAAFLPLRAVEKPDGDFDPTVTSPAAERVVVTAKNDNRLQEIDPELGNRIYQLGPAVIDGQGRGQDAGFDEVLLHAPGVSRESGGQYHLRGEDYGLQYRLNGIQLPEGTAHALGQPFDTRLIRSVSVLAGALPAQYGLRNAGVIDLETRSGPDLSGQEASLYGGSRGTLHPSYSGGGKVGNLEFFGTAAYLQNDLGTDNVAPGREAIHDQTRQRQGFALATYQLAPNQKLSVIFSGVDADFQIPNERGLSPAFSPEGRTAFDSARLDRNQHEQNDFGIVSYQLDTPVFGLLLAEVNSDSATHYRPDRTGDLLFTGVASDARRDLLGTGVQLDTSWRVADAHTLRAGLMVISQRVRADSANTVFPTDPETGEVSSDQPETRRVSEERRGTLYGVYLQDEWRLGQCLTLNLGGRFDGVSAYTHESAFSPRLNLTWQPWSALTLHAGYARIFSPPLLERVTRAEFARYVNTTNAPDTLVDDPARAERSHSFDVGASWQVVTGLTLGADAYYKSVRNMQDEEQLGASLIFTPFTFRRGYKEGVEFTAGYQWGDWLLYGNVAVAETKGRGINSAQGLFDADELGYIARHDIHTDYDQLLTVSAGTVYRWQRLALHADLLYGSGFFGGEDNLDQLPAHGTVNAGADYTFSPTRWASLTLRFDVINLFDQSYLLHDAGIGATTNQYGERRGFFSGVRCAF